MSTIARERFKRSKCRAARACRAASGHNICHRPVCRASRSNIGVAIRVVAAQYVAFQRNEEGKGRFHRQPFKIGDGCSTSGTGARVEEVQVFRIEFDPKTLPHGVVFALSNDESITALPVTIPHRERALGFLKRGDAGALASRRSFRSRHACRLRKPRRSDQAP
jgi:hypothetical protein